MQKSILDGITRPAARQPTRNPVPHCPVRLQNRLELEVVGPDETGKIVTKARRKEAGNILTSYGLDQLVVGLAAGTPAANFIWVSAMGLGTDGTAPASTQTALVASTASVSWGAGALTGSRSGQQTLNYQATFSGNQACTLNEVGVFGSDNITTRMVARKTFSTVQKQSNDTVNVTYQIIAQTA